MRLEHQITHPRLLRKPAPASGPAAAADARRGRGKANGSRFLGAALLDEDQKRELARALRDRRIGDDTGRQIFIGALEYQLSAFGPELTQTGKRSRERDDPLDRVLRGVVDAARRLSDLLRDLPFPVRADLVSRLTAGDERRSDREANPLADLGVEVGRIAVASASLSDAASEHSGPPAELVAKLAKAFGECFEQTPTGEPDGPFQASLGLIAKVTGLAVVPGPRLLAAVIAGDGAGSGAAAGRKPDRRRPKVRRKVQD